MYRVSVHTSGPLFDGRAHLITHDLAEDIRTDLAATALGAVMQTLASPNPVGIRKRTPYYETRLNVDESRANVSRVNDDNVIYGPWLEGVGSRNRPRPGFPGYHAFEKAYRIVLRDLPRTVEHHVNRAVDKLNGA